MGVAAVVAAVVLVVVVEERKEGSITTNNDGTGLLRERTVVCVYHSNKITCIPFK